MLSKKLSLKDRLLYFIVILLGFQQFPIIRAGGSLKIYEILGFILMGYNIIHFKGRGKTDYISFFAFLLFVIIPIFDYLYTSIFFEYPTEFFLRWPTARGEFKASYYVFPLLQLVYMCMNYSVFKSLLSAETIYKNFFKVMKIAVVYGTIIAAYSLFAIFVFDVVHFLPSWIQFKVTSGSNRSTGLSQEPGTYVLYQIWICLFLWYARTHYKKAIWYIIFFINVFSLLLTQSTAIWGLFMAIIAAVFVFKSSTSSRIKTVLIIVGSIIVLYVVIRMFNYQAVVERILFTKVKTFISAEGYRQVDSGSTRKYYSALGFLIYFDYPFLGVGYGRSMYYMYQYQFQNSGWVSAEGMNFAATPMNLFSIIAAELGTIGLIAFFLFYFAVLSKFWKNRNKSKIHQMFLIGAFVELAALLSLYTPHAVFLWAYLGLGVGYMKYFDREKAKKDLESNIQQTNGHMLELA